MADKDDVSSWFSEPDKSTSYDRKSWDHPHELVMAGKTYDLLGVSSTEYGPLNNRLRIKRLYAVEPSIFKEVIEASKKTNDTMSINSPFNRKNPLSKGVYRIASCNVLDVEISLNLDISDKIDRTVTSRELIKGPSPLLNAIKEFTSESFPHLISRMYDLRIAKGMTEEESIDQPIEISVHIPNGYTGDPDELIAKMLGEAYIVKNADKLSNIFRKAIIIPRSRSDIGSEM